MQTVYKYELLSGTVRLPKGFKFLSCQFQGVKLTIWVQVDPNQTKHEDIEYWIVSTGGIVPEGDIQYWASLQEGSFVWHIFSASPKL